jgi:hypothetical protein
METANDDSATQVNDTVLKEIYQDQRAEVAFRRDREQQIFTWSTNIQLALLGGLFLLSSRDGLVLSLHRRDVMCMAMGVVVILTYYSARWQLHQRKLLRDNQKILANIADLRGWFGRGGLRKEWREWGARPQSSVGSHKAVVTVLFGFLGIIAVWFVATSPAASKSETIPVKLER